MNKDVAEKIHLLMLQITAQVNDSVALVMDTSSQDDFHAYRRMAGRVMGEILVEVLHPLWDEHPSLKPEDVGGSYVVDPAIYEPRFYATRGEQ